jgi:DNA-binding NarL/FixJ family response regulator
VRWQLRRLFAIIKSSVGHSSMTMLPSILLNRALIVEDDPAGWQRMLGLLTAVAGETPAATVTTTIAKARAAVETATFDIALVDVGLPDGTGIELIAWLHARHPDIACIVITAWGDGDTVLAAVRAGAIGYLLKDRDDAELSRALQSIQRGGSPIDPFVARGILAALKGKVPLTEHHSALHEPLSTRERQILDLVAHGHNNRQIAQRIGLSRFTVEDYTKQIYRKLAVASRAEAVYKAQAQGLLG